MSSGGRITLRFRNKYGMWRLNDVDPNETVIAELKARIASERGLDMGALRIVRDRSSEELPDGATCGQLGLRHGAIVGLEVASDYTPSTVERKVDADGNLVEMTFEEVQAKKGFRPGAKPMSAIKRVWNCTEMDELQKAFEFNIKAQGGAHCRRLTIDNALAESFITHAQRLAFQQCRCATLYGIYRADNEIEVIASFEQLQIGNNIGFTLLEDAACESAEAVAGMLGLSRVGMLFSHAPREDDVIFHAGEALEAMRQQVNAAKDGQGLIELRHDDGLRISGARAPGGERIPLSEDVRHATLFTIVRMKPLPDNTATLDMYQMSDQALEMYESGAFAPPQDPTTDKIPIHSKYTAICEGKAAKEVPVEFFLNNVPAGQSRFQLGHDFPVASRREMPLGTHDLKDYLQRHARGTGRAFADGLADFNLLTFLHSNASMTEVVEAICADILNPSDEGIGEGYEMLLKGFAGIELE